MLMAQASAAGSGAGTGGASLRVKVQRFGSFLSGMVMPNIGAFIAWGLITAIFIPDGWYPNERLAQLVDPMILYLLPLLIAYTGGRMVYGARGAVVGAIATIGAIVGSDIPMFLGALIMGPLGGYLIMKFDDLVAHRVRQGFEMLVSTFSAGIIGGTLAIIGVLGAGPVISSISNALGAAVDFIVALGLLPLVSIIVEPAKVLFLNNAINHGILAPLAIDQAQEAGKSILFMVETNPGPGLGILLAYSVFGRGLARSSAPGAAVIQFFGGIHEIYFPYVLMKPALILAAIAGGASGIFTATVFNAGLVSTPAPGSIFAYITMTQRGRHPDRGRKDRGRKDRGRKDRGRKDRRRGYPRVRPSEIHRVRLRRRNGLQRDGSVAAQEQGQAGRYRGRLRDQRFHQQPLRGYGSRYHPQGPHRPGQGEGAECDSRLGGQLPRQ